MTGEGDAIKKEELKICLERKKEKLQENSNEEKHGHRAVPSPILLSGTRVGLFLYLLLLFYFSKYKLTCYKTLLKQIIYCLHG